MRHDKTCAALCALALGGAATTGWAATLCETACNISLGFADGASITASGSATLTFGNGGSLVLGDGGSIEPGPGGSVSPVTTGSGAPDFSNGGTITLGDGGVIRFGPDGALKTGDQGGITVADAGHLDMVSALNASITAPGAVHLGRVRSGGDVTFTAQGRVVTGDSSTPIHFTMRDGDSTTQARFQAGADLSFDTVDAAGSTSTTQGGDGSSSNGSGSTITTGGSSSASSTVGSGGTVSPVSGGAVTPGSIELQTGPVPKSGGGAFDLWLLMPLLAVASRRHRPRINR